MKMTTRSAPCWCSCRRYALLSLLLLAFACVCSVTTADGVSVQHSVLDQDRDSVMASVRAASNEEHPVLLEQAGSATLPVQSENSYVSVELFAIASLQLILVLVAYRLDRSTNPVLISESVVAMCFGVLFGAILRFTSSTPAASQGMNPEILFYALLPPIILEAGFSMKKRGFFANFSTILLLAIVGTLIAMFVIGGILLWFGNLGIITKLTAAEAYLYGALISAVDPVATLSVFKKNGVPPLLFNLVFGESMLNDGVAIVAFVLFQQVIKSGNGADVTLHDATVVIGKVFGIGFGSVMFTALVCFTSAFLLKHADPVLRQYPAYEISIVLLSAYLSYVAADMAGLSGIVALFFSGVLMSHYHLHTIAEESATALRHLMSTVAFIAENFIFIYLGMSVVAYSGYFTWDIGFIFVNLLACLFARVLSTFPLCAIANLGRREKITWQYMVVIWFAGLRGAIAFALALNVWTKDPTHSGVIQSSTLFTVMFTTVVFGMGTGPVLRHFGLSSSSQEALPMNSEDADATESLLADRDDITSPFERDQTDTDRYARRTHDGIHGWWEHLDEAYLKPLFGGQLREEIKSSPTPSLFRKRPSSSTEVAIAMAKAAAAATGSSLHSRAPSNSNLGTAPLTMNQVSQQHETQEHL